MDFPVFLAGNDGFPLRDMLVGVVSEEDDVSSLASVGIASIL